MTALDLKIGIDVGGTNTDAALLSGDTILGSCKLPTTPDVMSGVRDVVASVIAAAAVDPSKVTAVMVGTTHFLNALVQRKGLSKVGVLRLCGPTGRALPPMVDWPDDLRTAVKGDVALLDGGVEFDGHQITQLDPDSIRAACARWRDAGIKAVAVSAVFSLVDNRGELEAARIITEEIPDANISLSHQIGQNGLLQRESATILNAALHGLSQQTIDAFKDAFQQLKLSNAALYLTRNDGTLMNADYAMRFPVQAIASGPTNSMRGAAFLTGLKNAAVVDIGGTTTDIGMIVAGFPRSKSEGATIAGVPTNFRVPDVLSFGLGGGSIVKTSSNTSSNADELEIGPESVGYRLQDEARCFGGDTLTATDLVVAMGHIELGNPSLLSNLKPELLAKAQDSINTSIASVIDRMKPSAEPIPAIFVGGGSILVHGQLEGISEVIIPEHFGAANAIGAAIAQVSGEMDRIVSLDTVTRNEALQQLIVEAKAQAVAAGASADSLELMDIAETPLAYLPGNAVRMTAKVIGDLQL